MAHSCCIPTGLPEDERGFGQPLPPASIRTVCGNMVRLKEEREERSKSMKRVVLPDGSSVMVSLRHHGGWKTRVGIQQEWAIRVLQACYRGSKVRRVGQLSQVRQLRRAEMQQAAIKLQCTWRGSRDRSEVVEMVDLRKYLSELHLEEVKAARTLQKTYRGLVGRRVAEHRRVLHAVEAQARREEEALLEASRLLEEQDEKDSEQLYQYSDRDVEAALLTEALRRKQEEQERAKQMEAKLAAERERRRNLAIQRAHERERMRLSTHAVKLQTMYRSYVARVEICERKMQADFERRAKAAHHERSTVAAESIQASFRGFVYRRREAGLFD